MNDKPTSLNAEGISEPFASENVPWKNGRKAAAMAASFDIFPDLAARTTSVLQLEELAPGKESNMNHYHMLEEEQAFILEGEMTLRLGDKTYRMKAGDHVVLSCRTEGRTFVLQPQRRAMPLHHDRREKPERSCVSIPKPDASAFDDGRRLR